jgi:hypothetical protein
MMIPTILIPDMVTPPILTQVTPAILTLGMVTPVILIPDMSLTSAAVF